MTVRPFRYRKPTPASPADPTVRVLISSPDTDMKTMAPEDLDPTRFDVRIIEPGPGFVRAAIEFCPHVVVLDRVDERAEGAQMELAVVKDLRPYARVIIISEQSSASDATIVEQGVFYYLASLDRQELARVIKAAARCLHGNQREVQS